MAKLESKLESNLELKVESKHKCFPTGTPLLIDTKTKWEGTYCGSITELSADTCGNVSLKEIAQLITVAPAEKHGFYIVRSTNTSDASTELEVGVATVQDNIVKLTTSDTSGIVTNTYNADEIKKGQVVKVTKTAAGSSPGLVQAGYFRRQKSCK